jgi:hypothetical protein
MLVTEDPLVISRNVPLEAILLMDTATRLVEIVQDEENATTLTAPVLASQVFLAQDASTKPLLCKRVYSHMVVNTPHSLHIISLAFLYHLLHHSEHIYD